MLDRGAMMPHALPDWENPAVLGINKRRTHVPLRSHSSPSSAAAQFNLPTAAGKEGGGPERLYQGGLRRLSGCPWAFRLFPCPAAVPPGFPAPGFDASGWAPIPVPCSWECAGHGTPIYTNFVYPIPLDPPFVPRDDNPTGCYLHSFSVDEAQLKDKRCEGEKTSFRAKRVHAHHQRSYTMMQLPLRHRGTGSGCTCPRR